MVTRIQFQLTILLTCMIGSHALLPPSATTVLSKRRNNSLLLMYSSHFNEDNSFNAFIDDASEAILDGQDLEIIRGGAAYSPQAILSSIKLGFSQRVAADPSFLSKSILEVILAATTQFMAEVSKRGRDRIIPEIDFVFAGILTAIFGKYYSSWRVAKTIDAKDNISVDNDDSDDINRENTWRERVPTNAFQRTLLDGYTSPTLSSRALAFLLPMPQLFRAGVIASTIGYGLTSSLIWLRTIFMPSYVAQTSPVSVPLVALYTGAFMALVSNIRYQCLQGVVEPYLIEAPFDKLESIGANNNNGVIGNIARCRIWKSIRASIIISVRWGNGLLGSWIAISGMRAFKLQRLAS